MKFRIVFTENEDGWLTAECLTLPGCISQGKNREDATANIREAIEAYLESLKKSNAPLPPPIQEEVIELNV